MYENYIDSIYIVYKSEQDLITSIKTYTIISWLIQSSLLQDMIVCIFKPLFQLKAMVEDNQNKNV